MRIWLSHPEIASRPCEECKAWMFDEKTGRKALRGGLPIPRPPGTPTPCGSCPKKSPEEAKRTELKPHHWRLLALYHECRGAGSLPLDDITRHRLGIIEQAFREHDQRAGQLLEAYLMAMARK